MKKSLPIFLLLFISIKSFSKSRLSPQNAGAKERAYLVKTLIKIADPVLNALSKNELRKTMPVEEIKGSGREKFTHLEAFGRLLSGMAPWLELGADNTQEGKLRAKYIALARKCIRNATDSTDADYMNFSSQGQPLVDAAFFAQALLRAPQQLWNPLDPATKANVIAALRKCDNFSDFQGNWVMFSASIETALYKFTGTFHRDYTKFYINRCIGFYKGDGAYGDGKMFHWDYYNSYVMQPMLIDDLTQVAH